MPPTRTDDWRGLETQAPSARAGACQIIRVHVPPQYNVQHCSFPVQRAPKGRQLEESGGCAPESLTELSIVVAPESRRVSPSVSPSRDEPPSARLPTSRGGSTVEEHPTTNKAVASKRVTALTMASR